MRSTSRPLVLSSIAIAGLALAACPTVTTPGDPPVNTDPVDDDTCAGGGVAVGFPLREGSYTIGQGNHGAFSHSGVNDFAFDFTVDKGTDVVAARSGTVVFVKDGEGDGGPDASLAARANIVVVDHGGGTFDSYFHLQAGSFAVDVGDRVNSGDLLAKSGNSGFSSGPHLHFAVVDAVMQSLPACFEPGDLVPDTDDSVDAVASPLKDPGSFPRSTIASDTYEGTHVIIDNDVEAFIIDGTVHVEGHITDDNHRAAVFLAPFGGSGAIVQAVVDVDGDGAFVADLDCSGFEGIQSLGMGSVSDTTNEFTSDVLAPVIVR